MKKSKPSQKKIEIMCINKVECYMGKGGVVFEYDMPKDGQTTNLEILGITYAQAMSYKKYC